MQSSSAYAEIFPELFNLFNLLLALHHWNILNMGVEVQLTLYPSPMSNVLALINMS